MSNAPLSQTDRFGFNENDRRAILQRCLDDLVEQTYTIFESRGEGRAIRRDWIEYWLKKGKGPLEVVNIAIGCRRAPDAHLGGRR